MKLHIALISCALAFSQLSWADADHKEHKPLHGGQLVVVKDIDYELVTTATNLRLYVRDHGKPIDLSKASAKLTLLSGSEKQEVELKPNGDALEAKGTFKLGASTKIAAVITNNGKQASARFVSK